MYMTMHLKSNYLKICFLNVQANIFPNQILWRKKNKPIGLQRFSKNQNHLDTSYEILILKFQTPSIRLWCLAKHLMFIWMTKLVFKQIVSSKLKSFIQWNEKSKWRHMTYFHQVHILTTRYRGLSRHSCYGQTEHGEKHPSGEL